MTTTNTIEKFESVESCINSLVESLVESETLTLNERINKNTVDSFNYLKHDGGKGRITAMLYYWIKSQIYVSLM